MSAESTGNWGATVTGVIPGGAASKLSVEDASVEVGHRIVAIDGTDIKRGAMTYERTFGYIRAAHRPVNISFENIFAVSREVAAYCEHPANHVEDVPFVAPTAVPPPAPAHVVPTTGAGAPHAAPVFNPGDWYSQPDAHGRTYYVHRPTGQTTYSWPPQ